MKEYSLLDLKSSRLQYDKNPPKLLIWVIFTLFIGIIAIIVISCFTYKTEVVRATGILSSENKTYISSKKQGEIKEVYKNSGDYVNKGDLLFEINDIEIQMQEIAIESKTNLIKEYVEGYELIIDSLKNITDYSSISNPFNDVKFKKEFDNIISQIEKEETEENKKNMIESYQSQYENQVFQYKYEYLGLSSQLEAYEGMKDEYKVYANESGYINYSTNLKSGMVISNDILGTISDEITKDNSIVEVYVDTANISFLKENMDVEMIVSGLSQTTYGALKGKVKNISTDSITSEDKVFYKVEIKPDDIVLKNKNKTIDLSNGVVVETRIKYESITWMNWVLKKMGIIDR